MRLTIKRNNKRYPLDLKLDSKKFSKRSSLILEEQTRLGELTIYGRQVFIGAHSYIRSGSAIYSDTSIGRFCSIANNVTIGLDRTAHPLNWLSTSPFQYDVKWHSKKVQLQTYLAADSQVIVGNDVWIGEEAKILAGVEVGHGAVIAAHSLVVKNVPPYAIVGGNPAKIIKYRFDTKLIAKLLEFGWWNKDIDCLLKHDLKEISTASSLFMEEFDEKEVNYKTFEIFIRGKWFKRLSIKA